MRHRVSGRKLGRDSAHRKALRKNMIAELLVHEQILTTEAKARMLRPAAEKIITMAKRGLAKNDVAQAIHARRLVAARIARFRQAEDEDGVSGEVDVVKKLFDDIAPRYADRPGGYTRMVKIGKRSGDNADMALIMLVDGE
ncbi:MAG: 50S ribosomal protein L17 [Candidatus Promineifilaceae bacterium]|nr:50S ribosomal protein L17 [Anaerolineaceae bacterium]